MMRSAKFYDMWAPNATFNTGDVVEYDYGRYPKYGPIFLVWHAQTQSRYMRVMYRTRTDHSISESFMSVKCIAYPKDEYV